MQIQLTITLNGHQDDAAGIAQGAAEHLMETFNDDRSLKTAYFKVIHPEDRAAKKDLTRRVIAELSAWYEECAEIADAVSSTEEVVSYTERMNRVKALIKEVKKS